MDAASAVASQPASNRRLNLLQLLGFAAGVAFLIVGGLYTVRYLGATTFDQQRAFRALDETAGQLDNLQSALAGLLRLMRDDLFRDCAVEPLIGSCQTKTQAYKRRLAIEGVEPGVVAVDRRIPAQACAAAIDSVIVLRTRQNGVPSSAIRCPDTSTAAQPAATESGGRVTMYGLKGSLTEIVAGVVTQGLFDEVLIALSDGSVIASVPASDAAATDLRKPLHPARMARLNISDASALLSHEAVAARKEPEKDKDQDEDEDDGKAKAATAPLPASQPIVFSQTIGGDRYQVFVRLMRPKVPMYVDPENSSLEAQQQKVVYLIGLKRADLRGDVAKAISPGSRFWLTMLFLLALFAWPLANVKSKSAVETISWGDLVACLFSLVFIPATLAIGAVWCWSYLALERWADRGAASYAQSIKQSLSEELAADLSLLVQYRNLRGFDTTGCGWQLPPAKGAQLPIRSGLPAHELPPDPDSPETCRMLLSDEESSWSPFSSVFATNERGIRSGGLTAYRASNVRSNAPYAGRQYFQALSADQGWVAPEISGAEQFVAQRIFSFGDGARMLQLAIRRQCESGKVDDFCGIISGGSRVYALSAAVLPPLLKFAVIDRNTGSVLFHADDRRSLAENLFVETEQNASLRAAANVNRGAYFDGRYLGESHRFVYMPMDDLPWGIVVMYSQRDLGELPWHAGMTAFAAYAGLVLIVATFVTLFLLWRARCVVRASNPAHVLWPHESNHPAAGSFLSRLWRGACFYERCGVIAYGIIVLAVVIYEATELPKLSPLTLAMAALWVAGVGMFVCCRRRELFGRSSGGRGKVARQSHSLCLATTLMLISALPAAWMALGYQDAQVQGLVRDGLLSASRDIARRHDTIDRDLRRLGVDPNKARRDAWERTAPSATILLPGFAAGACEGDSANSDVWALCVFERPPLSCAIATLSLDFWRRETWRAAAPTEKQLRRIALLSKADKEPSCYGYEGLEQSSPSWTGCCFRGEDASPLILAAGSSSSTDAAWQSIAAEAASFDRATRTILDILPVLIVLMLIGTLASFANRRLFGCLVNRTIHAGRDPTDTRIVLYSAGAASKLARYLAQPATERINLAYSRLFLNANSFKPRQKAYVLDDLDLALADAPRRGAIVAWLEEVASEGAELIITARQPPLDRLDVHGASPDEILRWHALLAPLSTSSRQVSAAGRGKSASLCARERWQLCTREERLLLHQIASGALVNPLNRTVLEDLARRGEIKFRPWPTIKGVAFRTFVKRAGAEPEMTQLLQQSAGSNKSTRRTVLGLLLVVVLLLVVWFSWAAGDQFKIVSAILAGALAFLGQISQAFTFVRGTGQGSK